MKATKRSRINERENKGLRTSSGPLDTALPKALIFSTYTSILDTQLGMFKPVWVGIQPLAFVSSLMQKRFLYNVFGDQSTRKSRSDTSLLCLKSYNSFTLLLDQEIISLPCPTWSHRILSSLSHAHSPSLNCFPSMLLLLIYSTHIDHLSVPQSSCLSWVLEPTTSCARNALAQTFTRLPCSCQSGPISNDTFVRTSLTSYATFLSFI